MINDLVDGITRKIDELYQGKHLIRRDGLEQGSEDGMFFIKPLNIQPKEQLDYRKHIRCSFDVLYFPEVVDDGELFDNLDKKFDLLIALRYIDLLDGSRKLGKDMSAQIIDGVLHVFVSYDLYLMQAQEKILVKELQQYRSVKYA